MRLLLCTVGVVCGLLWVSSLLFVQSSIGSSPDSGEASCREGTMGAAVKANADVKAMCESKQKGHSCGTSVAGTRVKPRVQLSTPGVSHARNA